MTAHEFVEVWEESRGSWRWRFVRTGDDGERLELPSNESESSQDDAVSAAQVAYPGLPVQVPGSWAPSEASAPHHWRWAALTVLVIGTVMAVCVLARVRRRLPG